MKKYHTSHWKIIVSLETSLEVSLLNVLSFCEFDETSKLLVIYLRLCWNF